MNKLYQSYYTKSPPLVHYMIQQLCPETGLRFLDPAAGDGIFIDGLKTRFPEIQIDVFDIDPEAIQKLKRRFEEYPNITIKKTDTVTDEGLAFYSDIGGVYDRIIANPPYGAWQDYDKRNFLKKMYKDFYVKETYGLFLYRSIQLLKNKGRLVFIIPDTYLNLHLHKKLRQYILLESKIIEIALFPSSFFPGVNFGYSNLSIITLERCLSQKECLTHIFKVVTGFKHVESLIDQQNQCEEFYFSQKEVYEGIDSALYISPNRRVTTLINTAKYRISDVADCVTGIYSGNDKKFMRVLNGRVRNSSKYQLIEEEHILRNDLPPSLDGIHEKECFIPIVKGGAIKYCKSDLWFLDWSVDAVLHYKNNKKARFQNASFYFREGIGVPMVSSSNITASLLEGKLFDQSIVGIFPKKDKYLYYLLGFFNSPVCNILIRTINPSANNPANYIKKIPFIYPSEEQLYSINTLIEIILNEIRTQGIYAQEKEEELFALFQDIYGLNL